MRIFKSRNLVRFARRESISDVSLIAAADDAERGLIDADLGGGVIKQRVARRGQGKRGGYRVLIGFRSGERAIFLFGFAKNERDNIDDNQLATLKETAAIWFAASDGEIAQAIEKGVLEEIKQ